MAMPQDKENLHICVSARGYQVFPAAYAAPSPEAIAALSIEENFFPDIDSLLNWLSDHLAVPGA